MKKTIIVALFVLLCGIAWACSPTLQSVSGLIYNLQQLTPERQENSYVVRLYGNQSGYTGFGHYSLGFRFVCVKSVAYPPGLRLRQGRVPGPGPGPCYVQVVDWGTDPLGRDLTPEHCETLGAVVGIALE